MEVMVNGEQRELPEAMTVSQLLERLQISPERVVVEVNVAILKRVQHATTLLQEGDQVEIIHFVGGGAINRSRLQAQGSRQKQLPPASSPEPRAE